MSTIGCDFSYWYEPYVNAVLPLELQATQNSWKQAVAHKGPDLLHYKFVDRRVSPAITYSSLEFAVIMGDVESARSLIDRGANLTSDLSSGTMLHFYIDCLEEDGPPNLEMLNLLIDKCSVSNFKSLHGYSHPVVRALIKMTDFKELHWDVIEVLLKIGVWSMKSGRTSPFLTLRNSYWRIIRDRYSENAFLNRLVSYIALEKKHFPLSKSSLTLIEFKFLTSHLRQSILNIITLPHTSFIVDFFFNNVEMHNFPEFNIDISESGNPSNDFVFTVEIFRLQMKKWKLLDFKAITDHILKYHALFQRLVMRAEFRDCFSMSELTSIRRSLNEVTHPSRMAALLRNRVIQLGLFEDPKDPQF